MTAAAMVAVMAGCGFTTQSPPETAERERKAAGLSAFRIVCSPDLWEETGGRDGAGKEPVGTIPAKITKRPDGLVTVELSGPKLVDLLRYLDKNAHPGWHHSTEPDPLAIRMYDAIVPVLDAVTSTPKADAPPPEITIDDSSGRSTPSASPTAAPTKG